MPTTLRPSVLFLFAFAALFVAVALSPIPHSAAAEEAADDYLFSLELVVETPLDPVGLAHAGDDRLFVVERRGFIRIIEEGELFEDPFLDISDQVVTSNWEQGLLGLVFHPDYDQNGYFYVNYTGVDGDTRVSRFQVSAGDPNQADPDSEQVILLVAQPEADHNGGTMVFGPDGYLYVALGDGGLINNYPNAQKRDTLLGKLLRIDVDGEAQGAPDCDISGEQQYTVPADNPFFDGLGGDCDEIWVLGLRNPWRFSFDSASGDLYIADVGGGRYEEINVLPAGSAGGANFGWPCYEGAYSHHTGFCDDSEELIFPVAGYEHEGEGICMAITGGEVYHGAVYPQLQGYYFFADFCTGRVWRLRHDGQKWQQRRVADVENTITSLASDRHGELYATGLEGGVYRMHAHLLSHRAYLPLLTLP